MGCNEVHAEEKGQEEPCEVCVIARLLPSSLDWLWARFALTHLWVDCWALAVAGRPAGHVFWQRLSAESRTSSARRLFRLRTHARTDACCYTLAAAYATREGRGCGQRYPHPRRHATSWAQQLLHCHGVGSCGDLQVTWIGTSSLESENLEEMISTTS